MANNQNNETANSVGLAMAVFVMALFSFGLVIVGIAAFATLAALMAQIKPVKIGDNVLTAKEGRLFILRGLAWSLPCMAVLLQIATALKIVIQDDWVWAVYVLAYSISALVVEWANYTFWGGSEKPAPTPAPAHVERAPVEVPLSAKVYNFADWQDDDEVDPYK